jgi:hypothetical protein
VTKKVAIDDEKVLNSMVISDLKYCVLRLKPLTDATYSALGNWVPVGWDESGARSFFFNSSFIV